MRAQVGPLLEARLATTTKSAEFTQAFELKADDAKALWAFVSEAGKEARLVFECSDGSKIDDDRVETLLEFPNTKIRRITSIELRNGYRSDTRVRVTATATYMTLLGPRISYEVVGEDKNVVYLSGRIEEIIRNLAPWYSPIASISASVQGGLFGVLLVAGLACAVAAGVFAERGSYISSIAFAAGFIFSFLCLSFGMRTLRLLFPPVVFAIGAGRQPAERAAFLRRAIATTLGIGLGIGVVASVIGNWLSK